jgi:recombination protein RecT
MTNIITYLKIDKSVVSALINKGLTRENSINIIGSLIRTISQNPKLMQCTKESILNCLSQAAGWNLDPDPSHGFLYLIPYGDTCKIMLGARGMKCLLFREESILDIKAHVVREGDMLDYSLADSEVHTNFKPTLWNENPIMGVFALATFVNGNKHFVSMSKGEIDSIRAKSKSSNIWNEHYDQMAIKTVLRRLYKELPIDTLNKISLEADNEEFNVSPITQVKPSPVETGSLIEDISNISKTYSNNEVSANA